MCLAVGVALCDVLRCVLRVGFVACSVFVWCRVSRCVASFVCCELCLALCVALSVV